MQAVEGLLVVVGQRLVLATVKPVLYYDHSVTIWVNYFTTKITSYLKNEDVCSMERSSS